MLRGMSPQAIHYIRKLKYPAMSAQPNSFTQLLTPVLHHLLSPALAVGDQQGVEENKARRDEEKRHIIIDAAVKSLFVGGPLI